MEILNYQTLEKNNYDGYLLKEAPEKVLQFGEGNFLRAFADYFIDLANEKAGFYGKTVVVTPVHATRIPLFREQDCLYTVVLRGIENGKRTEKKRIISSVSRCLDAVTEFEKVLECVRNTGIRTIISNTTEAGIAFCPEDSFDHPGQGTFPAKLTRVLYHRYFTCGKKSAPGFLILPCELIDENGRKLRECVERYSQTWGLDSGFIQWVKKENLFCNTLVDRIVPGYPKEEADAFFTENHYVDRLLDTAEPFGFWAVEYPDRGEHQAVCTENTELLRCFEKAGLPVLVTSDITMYKKRKVLVLNGAHTSMCTAALLSGVDTVGECLSDREISVFLKRVVYEEIIPAAPVPEEILTEFASAVFDRFRNPYIRHELRSISLNTTSKWKARVLPSVKGYYQKFGKLPELLLFGFASNLMFGLSGKFELADDAQVLQFFSSEKEKGLEELAEEYCSESDFWGEDLSVIPGFLPEVIKYCQSIEKLGEREALKEILIHEENAENK